MGGSDAKNTNLVLLVAVGTNTCAVHASGTLQFGDWEVSVGGSGWANVMFFEGLSSGCGCVADITGDGVVNVSDLLTILGVWGSCEACEADINEDGFVNVTDLLIVIGEWGPCN